MAFGSSLEWVLEPLAASRDAARHAHDYFSFGLQIDLADLESGQGPEVGQVIGGQTGETPASLECFR